MSSISIHLLLLCVFNGVFFCCGREYVVPQPTIELIYPRGFSVKIPDSEGISIFAFHGKINEKMEFLEAGRFSKDIGRRTGDFWIFEDRHTSLKVGDKIYYWLFVIKDKLGYRLDDGEFTVTDDTPYRTDTITQETTTYSAVDSPSTVTNNEHTTTLNEAPSVTTVPIGVGNDCRSTIVNITDALLELRSEVNSLKDINEILREISEKHPDSARTLKIDGRIPVNEDALVTVKGIIKQKLLLSVEIDEAQRNKDGSITFKTKSLDDKVQIVRAAKEKLRYSRIYLTY